MSARLMSRDRHPAADGFYQHNFKQLSDIQQKQAGLIIGAAVADAAARPLDGYSVEEITGMAGGRAEAEDAVVFANSPKELRGYVSLSTSGAEAARCAGANPLEHHSFSYLMLYELLKTMSSARGDFPVDYVSERWVSVAGSVVPDSVFGPEHASLLNTLVAVLPLPTIYPYAGDEVLRRYSGPFVDFLTEPPATSGSPTPRAVIDAERAAVRDAVFSALGVALRYLQTNPDAVGNAAFMSVPGTQAIFPGDVAPHCPPAHPQLAESLRARMAINEEYAALAQQRGAVPLPRPALADACVVQEGLSIARAARSYSGGVCQAIRLGGRHTCQRALLVGALLGARFGVRRVPAEWLSATRDHKAVVAMAIEVAQWSWNPPHR